MCCGQLAEQELGYVDDHGGFTCPAYAYIADADDGTGGAVWFFGYELGS